MNLESRDSRLLRNERNVPLEQLELSADGTMANVPVSNGNVSDNETIAAAARKAAWAKKTVWGEKVVKDKALLGSHSEKCDMDFVFGNQNSNKCDNRSTYGTYSELTETECEFAAKEVGARTIKSDVAIDSTWYSVRPKGCFVFPCNDKGKVVDKPEWCLYENFEGAPPVEKGIFGRPVCRRDRYVNGKAVPGANVYDPSMCPQDYQVIDDFNKCQAVAQCVSVCKAKPFNVGEDNAFGTKDNYPPGCFIKPESASERACVHWNPIKLSGNLFAPNNPVSGGGIPICEVLKPDRVNTLKKDDFYPPKADK